MERENEISLSVPYQKIGRKAEILSPGRPEQNFMGPLHTGIARKENIGTWSGIVIDLVKRSFRLGNIAEQGGLGHRKIGALPGMSSIRSRNGPTGNTDPKNIDRCQKQHPQYLIPFFHRTKILQHLFSRLDFVRKINHFTTPIRLILRPLKKEKSTSVNPNPSSVNSNRASVNYAAFQCLVQLPLVH